MANVRKAKAAEAEAPEVPAAEASEAEPEKEEVEETSFFMYLGPTIQNVIQNAAIYKGTRKEVEAKLEKVIAKHPRIRFLLSPGERIVKDREDVNKPGTRLYAEYQRLVRGFKK